jgi:signal transduction histidine kinase
MIDRHLIKKALKEKSNNSESIDRLYSARLRLIYKNAPIGIIATVINSLILVCILWGLIPHRTLFLWLSAIIITVIFRSSITYTYMRLPEPPKNTGFWDSLSFASIVFSGFVWGSAGIFLFPANSIICQVFLAFVLGGMVAGAAGAFPIMIKYFFGYSLPALIPILIRFLAIGDEVHLAMGGMTLLFGCLIYFTAKYTNYFTNSSLKLSFENSDLIDHLIYEKHRIEKLNEDYISEINERKQTEERLMATLQNLKETQDMLDQSEKLALIGRLSSAIGHEILNPVHIIHLRLQLLEQMDALPEKVKETIMICEEQIKRVVQIIRDIGRFPSNKKQEYSIFIPTRLDEVINHALNLYEPELKEKNIKTDVQFHEDLPLVLMDREKIEQVLFNIISNSIDAMTNKQEKALRIKTLPSSLDGYVKVVISDTGKGIATENMGKIIDPFFTTKDPSKGSGLGLYMSYIIVKNHGGNLWAERSESGGASIFIELPVDSKK